MNVHSHVVNGAVDALVPRLRVVRIGVGRPVRSSAPHASAIGFSSIGSGCRYRVSAWILPAPSYGQPPAAWMLVPRRGERRFVAPRVRRGRTLARSSCNCHGQPRRPSLEPNPASSAVRRPGHRRRLGAHHIGPGCRLGLPLLAGQPVRHQPDRRILESHHQLSVGEERRQAPAQDRAHVRGHHRLRAGERSRIRLYQPPVQS